MTTLELDRTPTDAVARARDQVFEGLRTAMPPGVLAEALRCTCKARGGAAAPDGAGTQPGDGCLRRRQGQLVHAGLRPCDAAHPVPRARPHVPDAGGDQPPCGHAARRDGEHRPRVPRAVAGRRPGLRTAAGRRRCGQPVRRRPAAVRPGGPAQPARHPDDRPPHLRRRSADVLQLVQSQRVQRVRRRGAYGDGADIIITGDSPQEQRQYTSWVGRLARRLGASVPGKPRDGQRTVSARCWVSSTASPSRYFADIHGPGATRRSPSGGSVPTYRSGCGSSRSTRRPTTRRVITSSC